MQGTSTKLTAAGLASWIIVCLFYVLFGASWGPEWAEPPANVTVAFTGLVSFVTGWLAPEKAFINEEVPPL